MTEDDAQNGSDHVDAHLTVAFAISPFIKRHTVDSIMYSTSSMLRTIELCLGLGHAFLCEAVHVLEIKLMLENDAADADRQLDAPARGSRSAEADSA